MTDETLSQQTAEERNTNATSISERKREANRKNAQCSTGPKTEAGKNHSRRNAVKHGLLAKVLALREYESRDELRALSEELINDAQPEGARERLQVDLIVQSYWMLIRLQVAENASMETGMSYAQKLWRYEPDAYQDGLAWISRFSDARNNIELHGFADEATAAGLRELAHDGPLESAFEQANERAKVAASEKAKDCSNTREREFRNAQSELNKILEKLEDRARELDLVFQKIDERRQLPYVQQSMLGTLSETLLRYKTSTRNQLDRAMAELERLQRQRRGEVVPPPLKLTL